MSHAPNFLATCHLLLVQDGKLLMLYRRPEVPAGGMWSLPAGHLDGEETVRAATVREAREEIGVEVREKDLRVVQVTQHRRESGQEVVEFFLTADRWTGKSRNLEPEKHDGPEWFPLGELPGEIVPYVRTALAAWQRGELYAEHGY